MKSSAEFSPSVIFCKNARSTLRKLWKEIEQLQSFSVLSLAAGFVLPFDNLSAKVLAVPPENTDVQYDQPRCACEHRGSAGLSFPEISWTRQATEPSTGITFPGVLDNIFDEENNNSSFASEVLVGTGSRSMKVIKIKSFSVYAFGLYVHPDSICEKLGPKYASVPVNELNNRPDFYEDLLRNLQKNFFL
ncbi:hypothetical protein GIB67_025967 [Kingdonia uniflora]|uniref:Uncharacterized protein n=1 Tax=Kingdonia uniflora TaxID=39325 RepID=A0A7J7L825_9MAGN|nr:hypothetical protein GIB67_025967 [Kingdonia uniflora]